MPVTVRFGHATVLGAGTMGAQIAAHLANAGLQVRLLDVSEEAARQGLDRARKLRPDPFFVPGRAAFIAVGSLEELDRGISASDWIIEAVVENLEIKRALLARVDAHRAPRAVVTSNTSGILLAALAEGRSESFRRHWLGTHFFNPPRYLRLVEVIPTADTDPSVTQSVAAFIDRYLGKGVVIAKDTPAFIANRIGLFGVVRLLEALASGAYTIEEIDAATGAIIGRPKSATFRTIDIAGLDILAHVARDLASRLPTDEDRRHFELPWLVDEMIDLGLLGEKTGQGFYKRVRDGSGTTILTLDLAALPGRDAHVTGGRRAADGVRSDDIGVGPYVSPRPPQFVSLDAARSIPDTAERLRTLFLGTDRVGALLRQTLGPTLLYAARVAPEVAHSIDDVDRAMRWGFGWELGPFETLDAIGPRAVLDACDDRRRLPERFRESPLSPAGPDLLILRSARQRSRVVRTNPGASLVDLGDGVLCVEFHSKMNVIGGDTIAMIHAGMTEAAANFAALVVGNEAEHFSAGANVMLLLLEAQEGNWDEVDLMVRAFQRATMALKESPVPVVAAPGGLALGGGCEICLHADRVQAAAETYIGLVEVGLGLVPAGGGTKEMLLRTAGDLTAVPRVFETIGFATVSTSGLDGKRLRYLRDVDGLTMNRERLLADAKALALTRAREGYQPPPRRTDVPVGGVDTLAALSLGVHLAWRAGRISDHDALIGRKLAWILAGGDLPHRTTVTEDYLLDLEREAFLSLCGQPKTLERIGYTLKTGKTLRN